MQTPTWQPSLWVQPLPSTHAVPATFGTFGPHRPETMSRVPCNWHWPASLPAPGSEQVNAGPLFCAAETNVIPVGTGSARVTWSD
jgi:hypothetical protein